jgi:hypothetical protein
MDRKRLPLKHHHQAGGIRLLTEEDKQSIDFKISTFLEDYVYIGGPASSLRERVAAGIGRPELADSQEFKQLLHAHLKDEFRFSMEDIHALLDLYQRVGGEIEFRYRPVPRVLR